ncbi:MAG: hypothetical protein QXD55_00105 [Candidatus Aenigmatarchaeota archaeon]
MKIKDKISSWFIRNILIPKMEIINKPGFILMKFPFKEEESLREIGIPETLFVNLEKTTINPIVFYSIGKKFAYLHASMLQLPTSKDRNFKNFANFFVNYIGTIYGQIHHDINLPTKTLKLYMQNYIICPKNGLGYIFSEGVVAGIWSYAFQDYSIEAVQIKCQGRGDKVCEVICSPSKKLNKMKLKFFIVRDLENVRLNEGYKEMNKIREAQYAKNSLEDLINSGFIKYSYGVVNYKEDRYFLCEASLMYILERELKKLNNANKILFDVSFNWGKELIKKEKQDPCKFIMDFMPALGWGDIVVLKKENKYSVVISYFPWTKWADEINFTMIRGMLSGILSANRKVLLKKIKKDISKGYLSLWLSE